MMPPTHVGYGQRKKRVLWPYVVGAVIVCAFVAMIIGPQILVAWLVLSNHSKAQEQIAEKERAAKQGQDERGDRDECNEERARSTAAKWKDDIIELPVQGSGGNPPTIREMMDSASGQVKHLCYETWLASIDVRGATANGPVERVSLKYNFRSADPTRPPGKDVEEGFLSAYGPSPSCSGSKHCVVIQRFPYGRSGIPTVSPPACDYDTVWRAALASGVPANAVADIRYDKSSAPFWSFRVSGHPELDRTIGGTSCGAQTPKR